MRLLMPLLLGAVVAGCAHSQRGDLGAFLARAMSLRGAHIKDDGRLPTIETRWRFRPDPYGFIVRADGRFKEVDAWMRSALGPPYGSCELHCFYANAKEIGVAVQYLQNPDGTSEIICVQDPARWPKGHDK